MKVKNSATKYILKYLATGMGMAIALSSPYGSRKLVRNIIRHYKNKKLKEDYLQRKFYYLRRKKLIEYKDIGKKTFISLTENGKKQILKYDFEEMKIEKTSRWDGKWHLVMFDIPQSKKNARDALRLKLLDLGFLKFNNSVWLYPYECKKEVDFVAEFFMIGKYVHYAVAEEITNSKTLKKIFCLN